MQKITIVIDMDMRKKGNREVADFLCQELLGKNPGPLYKNSIFVIKSARKIFNECYGKGSVFTYPKLQRALLIHAKKDGADRLILNLMMDENKSTPSFTTGCVCYSRHFEFGQLFYDSISSKLGYPLPSVLLKAEPFRMRIDDPLRFHFIPSISVRINYGAADDAPQFFEKISAGILDGICKFFGIKNGANGQEGAPNASFMRIKDLFSKGVEGGVKH